jgi:hypothetical protein
MNKTMRIISFVFISFSLLACSLGNMIAMTREATPTATATRTVEIPKTRTPFPSPSPTPSIAAAQSVETIEICSLVNKVDIETILGEPASEPKNINGSCVFTNASDSLYMVSIAAGQDELAKGILEGQAMMMGFAGAPLDEARMAELKSLAASMDFKEFFSGLVSAAEGVPSPRARLVEDPKSDVVYWAWITAPPRRQAALVSVRGPSVVNINLVVAETQPEESMLAASIALADKIFEVLPPGFSVATPNATPDSSGVNSSSSPTGTATQTVGAPQTTTATLAANSPRESTPTWVWVPTLVGTPTWVGIPTLVGTATLVTR